MATSMENFDNRAVSPSIIEGGQETSYIFVRGLGTGAFAEANLYRKTEVILQYLDIYLSFYSSAVWWRFIIAN